MPEIMHLWKPPFSVNLIIFSNMEYLDGITMVYGR